MNLTYHHDGLGLTELCDVHVLDEPHPVNGAHHQYALLRRLSDEEALAGTKVVGSNAVDCGWIRFQRGPRDVPDSTPGILDGALLSVLIHRYECFQAGPFACDANDEVLGHLREALACIKERAQERAARGVLGKNEK